MPDLSRPVYPAAVEDAWFRMAARMTGRPDHPAVLSRLLPAVADLSDTFTRLRQPGFDDYASCLDSLLAYGFFYFPQSFLRAAFALGELLSRYVRLLPDTGRPVRILDLGAGSGGSGLGAVHAFAGTRSSAPLCLTAVDRSATSLELLRELLDEMRPSLWPALVLETRTSDVVAGLHCRESYDVILAGFVLNEVFQDRPHADAMEWLMSLLPLLRSGGLLLILEPATHPCARRLQHVRDRFAPLDDVRVLAPCLHGAPCPMNRETGSVCHEVRRWRPPPSASWLNRHLQREIHLLRFSFLALQRASPPPSVHASPHSARLVAPIHHANGRFVSRGCADDGRLWACEWLPRHLDPRARRAMAAWERGDTVHLEPGRVLGDMRTWRCQTAVRAFGFTP